MDTDLIDPATVRKFLGLLHERAAAALSHMRRPGVIQLVSIAPDDRGMSISPFAIGDVDSMLEAALVNTRCGKNVFVETRTVRPGRPKERGRGKIGSTVGTFAFVIDHDADTGRAGHINGDTTIVETSPGNSQEWLFLLRALNAGAAKPLGDRIRKSSGADHDSGVITQPFRVPGTVNYPTAKKTARGRVVVPTKLIRVSDRLWTPGEIEATFTTDKAQTADTQPRRNVRGALNGGAPHRSTPRRVRRKIAVKATPDMDRSAAFQSAVNTAVRAGMTPDQIEAEMRKHPDGPQQKYLEGGDRLRQEIDRSWHKANHGCDADGGDHGQFGDHHHAHRAGDDRVGDQFHGLERVQRDDDRVELGTAGSGTGETDHAKAGVDGAALLDRVYEFVGRFVVYPSKEARVAHVLWCAHCHLMDAWDCTPRLTFLSPEPGSGKSRALEITETLAPSPILAASVTPAYLFRRAAEEQITLLVDEADAVFSVKSEGSEKIRAFLNASHRRGNVAG